jgi:hypothetical protein
MPLQAQFYENDGTLSSVSTAVGGSEISYLTPFLVKTPAAKVRGESFDFSRQGLYRFFNPATLEYIYRISVGLGNDLDFYAYFSAMSSAHMIGADQNSSGSGISVPMMSGRVNVQCGNWVRFCKDILTQCGISGSLIEIVHIRTLGALNGKDDGHYVIQSIHGASKRMWCPTNGVYFRDSNGVHMSAQAFVAQIANNGTFPEMVQLGADKQVSNDKVNGFPLKDYIEEQVFTNKEAWWRRLAQDIDSVTM